MPPQFSLDTVFVLTPHAHLVPSDVTLTVMTLDADYIFGKHKARIISVATPLLDGCHTLADIAAQTGVPVEELGTTLTPLTGDGHLTDITRLLHAGSAEEFLAGYFMLCDFWAKDIFGQPFWLSMLSGHSSRSQVLGWGIEFYHRTVGADEHNAKSVAHCRDPELRAWLREHFEEECGHSEIFLDGLEACGFARDEVAASPPLPSSRALIEYMNGLAIDDSVAYLGCYGVLHSPRVGQTPERLNSQFDLLVGHYPFATAILDKIREHALLDLHLGHNRIVLERVAKRDGGFPPATAARILRAARGVVRAFCNLFAGIHEYYGQPTAMLPRRRLV